MATDAIITLERLRCIRERDASGHSEPYLWPALVFADNHTLHFPEAVGIVTPALGSARIVIKDNMRAGETAAIPGQVGVLRVRLEDIVTVRMVFLLVVLLEEDETPTKAMEAGFKAYGNEVRAAMGDELFILHAAAETQRPAIIQRIETRVRDRVQAATRAALSSWEKAQVLISSLNLDDTIGQAFLEFRPVVPMPFKLSFGAGTADHFEIDGRLQMRPVLIDRCAEKVQAVTAAQGVVNSIEAEIAALQKQLKGGGEEPSLPKDYLVAEIKRLRAEELAPAVAALEAARTALDACRNLPKLVSTDPPKAAL